MINTCKEVAAVDAELFGKSIEFNQIPLRQNFLRVFNLWSSQLLMIEVSTSISTRMASISALSASSARARLFSASFRFFWSSPVARGNQASLGESAG